MQAGELVADKYRLLERIGEGGMGTVWKAKHEITERVVALKILNALHVQSPALLERFLREAKLAGRLSHPGLVAVLDAGVIDSAAGGPFLVMELLEGVPLDRAILRAGRLLVGVALEILHGVALAMVEVHDKGIVHRDLKPSNLFMHRPGTGALIVKVVDFGISKVANPQSGAFPFSLTKTGDVIGSPRYMSPEQAAGDRTIDVRSDIHSMGAILYECIAGRPLFDALSIAQLAAQILSGPRTRLDHDGTAPRAVADLIERAVAIDRSDRFPSSLAFSYEVEKAMRELGHVPILSLRDGADRFMALLGPELPVLASGTSLLSEPLPVRPAPPVILKPEPVAPMASAAPVEATWVTPGSEPPIAASAPPAVHRPSSSPPPARPTKLRLPAIAAIAFVAVLWFGAFVGLLLTQALAPRSHAEPAVTHTASAVDIVDSATPASASAPNHEPGDR